jgi:hypothetical protein
MSIREKTEHIQSLISDLQDFVNEIDCKEEFNIKHYNIMCYDLTVNPMKVFITAKDAQRGNCLITTITLDFFDIFMCNKVVDEFEKELDYLRKTNANQAWIDDLLRIRSVFGI